MLDEAVRDRWTGDSDAPWTTEAKAQADLGAIADRASHHNLLRFAEVLARAVDSR